MTFYDELVAATAPERFAFMNIAIVRHACANGVDRATYLDFLEQAYHHVRQTCPLLQRARERCGPDDARYREALGEYLAEEIGHDEWILEDIAALGGDAGRVRSSTARQPCRDMVAHAYRLIDDVDPHAMLGMVHVLEGMSAQLASAAAAAIFAALAPTLPVSDGKMPGGFSYLSSHGALDQEHVGLFARLVDGLRPQAQATVTAAARDFYRLYGDMFRELGERHGLA